MFLTASNKTIFRPQFHKGLLYTLLLSFNDGCLVFRAIQNINICMTNVNMYTVK